MPYISQELRRDVDGNIEALTKILDWIEKDKLDGVMNYVITRLLRGQYNNGKYAEYNAAIGVLECAKLELYRKAVAPYEDIKIRENGDV
jgi:hypothetical protein